MGAKHINKYVPILCGNFVNTIRQHQLVSEVLGFMFVNPFSEHRHTQCTAYALICYTKYSARSQQPVKPNRMSAVIISLFPDAILRKERTHHIFHMCVFNHRCRMSHASVFAFFFCRALCAVYIQATFFRFSSIFAVDTQFHLFGLQFPNELCHRSFRVVWPSTNAKLTKAKIKRWNKVKMRIHLSTFISSFALRVLADGISVHIYTVHLCAMNLSDL